MTRIEPTHPETIHVFAVDAPLDEANRLARDPAALGRALGGVAVPPGRAEAIDPAALGELGLSTYLVDGLGAAPGPVRADAARLDAERRPVLFLLPRSVTAPMSPQSPLDHLGSYGTERARPPEGPLRSDAAERHSSATLPDSPDPARAHRRASGMVAMAALAAALTIAAIVWLVAAA